MNSFLFFIISILFVLVAFAHQGGHNTNYHNLKNDNSTISSFHSQATLSNLFDKSGSSIFENSTEEDSNEKKGYYPLLFPFGLAY